MERAPDEPWKGELIVVPQPRTAGLGTEARGSAGLGTGIPVRGVLPGRHNKPSLPPTTSTSGAVTDAMRLQERAFVAFDSSTMSQEEETVARRSTVIAFPPVGSSA